MTVKKLPRLQVCGTMQELAAEIERKTRRCGWCQKQILVAYEQYCKDCAHPPTSHRPSSTAAQQTCKEAACNCSAVATGLANTFQERQFLKRRIGYCIRPEGLFCTKTCAENWALKKATHVVGHTVESDQRSAHELAIDRLLKQLADENEQ